MIVKNEGSDQEVYQPAPELQPSPVHGRLTTILDSMLVSSEARRNRASQVRIPTIR